MKMKQILPLLLSIALLFAATILFLMLSKRHDRQAFFHVEDDKIIDSSTPTPLPTSTPLPTPTSDPEQPVTETLVPATITPLPTATPLPTLTPTPVEPTPTSGGTADGFFHVEDGKIIDPNGQEFIINGVHAIYGTFAGGDEAGYGAYNYEHAQEHLDHIRSLGVNTVKIYAYADSYDQTHKAKLLNAIQWARDRGFLVIVSSHFGRYNSNSVAYLTDLAQIYRDDPYVWISPATEPYCGSSICSNWGDWHEDHVAYVRLLRDNGYRSPILINTIYWSWDLTQIYQYPLGDDNLVYGAHRYANDNQTFSSNERQDADRLWGNLAEDSQFAIIVDEVGAYNGGEFANSIEWTRGFMDYATDWVNNRGGDGVVAFVWNWSDGNSLTNGNGSLSTWGNIFNDRYMNQVRSPQ